VATNAFTDDELATFAEQHLAYEVGAAANQAIAWYYSMVTTSRPIQSALLSAVLVHLRLLADFLHRDPRGDDVAAVHYLSSWESTSDPLGMDREAINGHVAHLAMRREVRPMWNPVEVAGAVFWEFTRFLDELAAGGNVGFVEALAPTREIIEGFQVWAGSYEDIGLESEGVDESHSGDLEPWYQTLPELPTRIRGS
jgi:hypothetical protein